MRMVSPRFSLIVSSIADERRQARERQGRGIDVGERARLGAENRGLLRDFLLVGAIASARQYAEYGVANLEIADASARAR